MDNQIEQGTTRNDSLQEAQASGSKKIVEAKEKEIQEKVKRISVGCKNDFHKNLFPR